MTVKCERCGEIVEPQRHEDEDSYWSECPKCGYTISSMIKWGFG